MSNLNTEEYKFRIKVISYVNGNVFYFPQAKDTIYDKLGYKPYEKWEDICDVNHKDGYDNETSARERISDVRNHLKNIKIQNTEIITYIDL